MKVRICISWQIVVDGEIDSLDIDTTTEDIGSDAYSFVELLEFFVTFDTYEQSVFASIARAIKLTALLERHQSVQR